MQPFRHYRTGEPLSQPAVYCTHCSAQIAHYPGDVDLPRDETMDLALTAWNTRAVNSHHDLIEALRAIKHSIGQAHKPGNDWRRELALIENLTDAILTKAEAGHG